MSERGNLPPEWHVWAQEADGRRWIIPVRCWTRERALDLARRQLRCLRPTPEVVGAERVDGGPE